MTVPEFKVGDEIKCTCGCDIVGFISGVDKTARKYRLKNIKSFIIFKNAVLVSPLEKALR